MGTRGGPDGVLTFNMLCGYLEKAEPSPHTAGFLDHKGGNFLFIGKTDPNRVPADAETATFQATQKQHTIEAYAVLPGRSTLTATRPQLKTLWLISTKTAPGRSPRRKTPMLLTIYISPRILTEPTGLMRHRQRKSPPPMQNLTRHIWLGEGPYMMTIEGGTLRWATSSGRGQR
ncbi:MAG: hypothetical protein IPJ40_13375 [Saprospirales bacterium]|nr:hypothetical protein [Saprospirales bacterium]